MASYWIETKELGAVKLVTGLPVDKAIRGFKVWAERYAKTAGLDLTWVDGMTAKARRKSYPKAVLFVEVASPPSAPERNQPKRLNPSLCVPKGKLPPGVLIRKDGVFEMGAKGEEAK